MKQATTWPRKTGSLSQPGLHTRSMLKESLCYANTGEVDTVYVNNPQRAMSPRACVWIQFSLSSPAIPILRTFPFLINCVSNSDRVSLVWFFFLINKSLETQMGDLGTQLYACNSPGSGREMKGNRGSWHRREFDCAKPRLKLKVCFILFHFLPFLCSFLPSFLLLFFPWIILIQLSGNCQVKNMFWAQVHCSKLTHILMYSRQDCTGWHRGHWGEDSTYLGKETIFFKSHILTGHQGSGVTRRQS